MSRVYPGAKREFKFVVDPSDASLGTPRIVSLQAILIIRDSSGPETRDRGREKRTPKMGLAILS
jgi:hypothetical protein